MRAYLLGGRPIYFPFLSGIFQYDCGPCESPCCRGPSLGIGRSRELVTLIQAQPKIALFAQPGFATSSMVSLAAPLEACWFLDRKHRCRLHHVVGVEAKPAGCRLFPFQTIRSAGEAVVVLPDFTCPITVADAPRDEGANSHDELALEMHRTGIPRGGHEPLAEPKDLTWDAVIPIERRIVDASRAHLFDDAYGDFAEVQLALTAKALGIPYKKDRLDKLQGLISTFLDDDGTPSKPVVHQLVALTGVFRMMASELPRRDLPALLVALSCVAGVYEGMRGAKMSPRTLVSIFRDRLPFLYVLAHLADRPILQEPERARRIISQLPAVRAPLLDVLEALVDNRQQTVAEPLVDILRAQRGTFAAPLTADAVAMLTGLGKVLLRTGVFVPV